MEVIGCYEINIVMVVFEKQFFVCIINLIQIRQFVCVSNQFVKMDKFDFQVIVEFGVKMQFELILFKSKNFQLIKDLILCR